MEIDRMEKEKNMKNLIICLKILNIYLVIDSVNTDLLLFNLLSYL